MSARIDPLAQQAEVGGRIYRLRLDCRNEAALVTVAEREYRVRLLQWREKAMLARFASSGEELLLREFVRLCTDVTDELPSETTAVLWEVASWINDPSRTGAGIPFDSRSVATVTLQLCRATQLRPADFDGRSAVEVEEMWQALGGDSTATREPAANTSATRIMIVPDEENAGVPPAGRAASSPPSAPAATPRWRLATSTNDVSAAGALAGGGTPPAQPAGTPAFQLTAASSDTASPEPPLTWGEGTVLSPDASPAQVAQPSPLSPPQLHRGGERVRVRGGSRAASQPAGTPAFRQVTQASPELRDGNAGTRVTAASATSPRLYVSSTPEHTKAAAAAAALQNASLDETDARVTVASTRPRLGVRWPVAIDRTDRTDTTHTPDGSPYPSYSSYSSYPTLFDELADRLAEAAADMGIGEV